ncbi:UvrD-helicase domain-containing protein [Candidatus Kaiserbacteria bacterium]|nr:UvrD-helicase domain-containing protein [Candidatus Kaiserbacteria bacterium]
MLDLNTLNAPQKDAVTTTTGPLLVLAGAGSGKTRVITYRIAYLIENGVAPHTILALTFTNKAAKEMRERVTTLIAENETTNRIESTPLVTTFHALGVRILREHHDRIGLKRQFAIYDRSDSNRAIKKSLEKAGYDPKQFEPRKMLSIISRAKGDALSRTDFLDGARSFPERVAGEVWAHYDAILREEQAVDFDDLLLLTLNLLQKHTDVREQYQNRFKYVHIDEYQDTNKVQYEIACLLLNKERNLCVVGDVDQNIYSWRGANVTNILKFEKHFPGCKTILLEENYRSTQTIIAASNSIIEKNVRRPEKKVFTNNHEGDLISLYVAMNGTEEAQYVARRAQELISNGASPAHISVLYRTNFQSRLLEEAFLDANIPYQLLGTKFFERKEIKDILSYLRYALNPEITADLARIVNTPKRGIGKVTLLKLIEGNRADIKGKTLEKVAHFEQLIEDIGVYARAHPVSNTLKFIMKQSGMEESLKNDGEEGLERLENLRELVTLATRYDAFEHEEAIERLLEDAALQSDQDEMEEEKEAVRLMTVHASKGLEFPYVFITGLEEGLFPHERIVEEKGRSTHDDEEERRLFYVALTRAEKKVFLSFAHLRTIFGSERVNAPSSFLQDISDDHLQEENPNGYGGGGGETVVYLD